jgi:hypothetical protein
MRMGVGMDGTMVHIRDEGWKELKVGCSFDIEVYPTWNKEIQEWEDLAHAVNNRYVAHLGGPELFGQMLWAEAKRRGWEGAADKEVVGDGAAWVWNQAQEHFYDTRQAVDWYHHWNTWRISRDYSMQKALPPRKSGTSQPRRRSTKDTQNGLRPN